MLHVTLKIHDRTALRQQLNTYLLTHTDALMHTYTHIGAHSTCERTWNNVFINIGLFFLSFARMQCARRLHRISNWVSRSICLRACMCSIRLHCVCWGIVSFSVEYIKGIDCIFIYVCTFVQCSYRDRVIPRGSCAITTWTHVANESARSRSAHRKAIHFAFNRQTESEWGGCVRNWNGLIVL